MNALFTTPITNQQQAEDWLWGMHNEGLSFHPEDSPDTVISSRTKTRIFTDAECVHVRDRITEVYMYLDDPCDVLLSFMHGGRNEYQ